MRAVDFGSVAAWLGLALGIVNFAWLLYKHFNAPSEDWRKAKFATTQAEILRRRDAYRVAISAIERIEFPDRVYRMYGGYHPQAEGFALQMAPRVQEIIQECSVHLTPYQHAQLKSIADRITGRDKAIKEVCFYSVPREGDAYKVVQGQFESFHDDHQRDVLSVKELFEKFEFEEDRKWRDEPK